MGISVGCCLHDDTAGASRSAKSLRVFFSFAYFDSDGAESNIVTARISGKLTNMG